MKKTFGIFGFAALLAASVLADVAGYTVSDVKLVSRLPWDKGVDIMFTVTPPAGGTTAKAVELDLTAFNGDEEVYISDRSIFGRMAATSGRQHLVWRPDIDYPGKAFHHLKVRVSVKAEVMEHPPYMLVKINGGEIGYAGNEFANVEKLTPAFRDYLVFRYIPPTTSDEWKAISGGNDFFWFGMPTNSVGYSDMSSTDKQREDDRHKVKLTKGFYFGVQPVTRGQMAALGFTGFATTSDSEYYRVALGITYEMARGSDSVGQYDYPRTDDVAPDSIVGRLRAATGLKFDLPTNFQWEYAVRADCTNTYLFTETDRVPNETERNTWFHDTSPTSRPKNSWGLFGLIGCCHQWTLTLGRTTNDASENNYYLLTEDATDPTGPMLSYDHGYRITRGSHYGANGDIQKRVYRIGYKYPMKSDNPAEKDYCGLRLCLTLDE